MLLSSVDSTTNVSVGEDSDQAVQFGKDHRRLLKSSKRSRLRLTVRLAMVNQTGLSDGAVFVAALNGFGSTVGLLFYMFVWISVVVQYRTLKSHFYLYVLAVGMSDMGFLLLTIGYCLPVFVYEQSRDLDNGDDDNGDNDAGRSMDEHKTPRFVGILQQFTVYSQAACYLLISVNRCMYANAKSHHHVQYACGGRRWTMVGVVAAWICSASLTALNETTGCRWTFDPRTFLWWIECQRPGTPTPTVELVAVVFATTVASMLYGATWLALRFRRQKSSTSGIPQAVRRQNRLLIQFTFVTVLTKLHVLASWTARFVGDGRQTIAIGAVVSILTVTGAASNAFVYIIWDRKIRHAVRVCASRITGQTDVVPVAIGNIMTIFVLRTSVMIFGVHQQPADSTVR